MFMESPWGQLTSIDLYDCNPSLLGDREKLAEFPSRLCAEIGMRPYGEPAVEEFGRGELRGLSLMQFIETSTITVHLDEAGGRAFVDIFSCERFDGGAARDFSKEYFGAERAESKTLKRG